MSNSPSQPYSVTYHAPYFYFQTDHGVTYSCAFSNITDSILPNNYDIDIIDFEFFPDGKPKADPRVADTVISILEQFTDNKGAVILYVCDAQDGRPEARQNLFTRWHRRMADRYDHQPVNVSAGGISLHGGVLTSKEFLYPDVLQKVMDDAPAIIQAKLGR